MRFIAAFVLLLVGLAHAQNQLLLIQRFWAASPTTESSDCVEVQTNGSYRFEHTSFDLGKPGTTQIHLGTLTLEERAQLTEILNDPALLSLSRPASRKGAAPGEEVWRISISRGDHQQLLAFANSSSRSLRAIRSRRSTEHSQNVSHEASTRLVPATHQAQE